MLRTRKYHKQSDTTSDEFDHKQNGHQRGDLEPQVGRRCCVLNVPL